MTNLNEASYGALRESIENEKNLDTNICWFCKQPNAVKKCAAAIDLHQNLTSKPGFGKVSYRWNPLTRAVPRCGNCQSAHERADGWSKIWSQIGLFGGMIIGFALGIAAMYFVFITLKYDVEDFENGSLGAFMLVTVAAGTLTGFFGGKWLGCKLALSASPDSMPINFARQHPAIAVLLTQGWKFGKPDVG